MSGIATTNYPFICDLNMITISLQYPVRWRYLRGFSHRQNDAHRLIRAGFRTPDAARESP